MLESPIAIALNMLLEQAFPILFPADSPDAETGKVISEYSHPLTGALKLAQLILDKAKTTTAHNRIICFPHRPKFNKKCRFLCNGCKEGGISIS